MKLSIKSILSVSALLITAVCMHGQQKTLTSGHFESSDGFILPYQISSPAENGTFSRHPLLLYLHGAGERGNDNISQLNHGRDLFLGSGELEDVIVVAPQCPSDGYWVDIVRPTTREECAARTFPKDKDITVPLKAVKELLDSLVDSGVVDTRRI